MIIVFLITRLITYKHPFVISAEYYLVAKPDGMPILYIKGTKNTIESLMPCGCKIHLEGSSTLMRIEMNFPGTASNDTACAMLPFQFPGVYIPEARDINGREKEAAETAPSATAFVSYGYNSITARWSYKACY